jgi:hypothetical protein
LSAPGVYEREARLRKVLALDQALARAAAGQPDLGALVGQIPLEQWTAPLRAKLARLAGLRTPPSDTTWALLVEHRQGVAA